MLPLTTENTKKDNATLITVCLIINTIVIGVYILFTTPTLLDESILNLFTGKQIVVLSTIVTLDLCLEVIANVAAVFRTFRPVPATPLQEEAGLYDAIPEVKNVLKWAEVGTQTREAWLNKHRKQEANLKEIITRTHTESQTSKARTRKIMQSFKRKVEIQQKEIDGKQKLLLATFCTCNSIAMNVDALKVIVHQQIVALQRQRDSNQTLLHRYEEVHAEVTRRFSIQQQQQQHVQRYPFLLPHPLQQQQQYQPNRMNYPPYPMFRR